MSEKFQMRAGVPLLVFWLLQLADAYTGAVMGKLTPCDDAKTGIEIDWDTRDFSVFTCPNQYTFAVQQNVEPSHFELTAQNSSFNPKTDVVGHKCITDKLNYDDIIPVRGDHRPNWAKYGEYLYVPVQRWLHNLEHGSIVLLYHPCVDQGELSKLRRMVTGCLYRHVITPYNKLSQTRPLALVGWGARLEMNAVDEATSLAFIRQHGRVAPEDIEREGLYDQYLIYPAVKVNDAMDNGICDRYSP